MATFIKSNLTNPTDTQLGKNVKFERIRRITGYLTGTLERWNDAKQSEEHDRVKHTTR
jgi:anaerobic ribonucleoside-triphosphate reductase